jgi:hypothetical protein
MDMFYCNAREGNTYRVLNFAHLIPSNFEKGFEFGRVEIQFGRIVFSGFMQKLVGEISYEGIFLKLVLLDSRKKRIIPQKSQAEAETRENRARMHG